MKQSQKLLESFKANLNEDDERLKYVQSLQNSQRYDKYTLRRLLALYDMDAPLDVLQLIEPFVKERPSYIPDYIVKAYNKKPYLIDLIKYIFNEKKEYLNLRIIKTIVSYCKEDDIDFIKGVMDKCTTLDACDDIIDIYQYLKRTYYNAKDYPEYKGINLKDLQQLILNTIKGNEEDFDETFELIYQCFKKMSTPYADEKSVNQEVEDSIYNNISNFLIELAKEDTRIDLFTKNDSIYFMVSADDWNWKEEKYPELADGTPKIWSTWFSKYKKFVNSELAEYNIRPVVIDTYTEDYAKAYSFSKDIGKISISATMNYVMGYSMELSIMRKN